jgi:hypothetical protein
MSRALGNWQINAIYLGRSGAPFTPITNLDIANIGGQNAASRVRPNLLSSPAFGQVSSAGGAAVATRPQDCVLIDS